MKRVKVGYTMLFAFWLSLALVLAVWSESLGPIGYLFGCGEEKYLARCLGHSLLLRGSMSLTLFHILFTLISIPNSPISTSLNRNFWTLKFFLLCLLFVLCFKLPLFLDRVYFWLSVVLSPLTILWLFLALMDLLFKLAEFMGEKYFEQGNKLCGAALVLASVGSFGGVGYALVWAKMNLELGSSFYAFVASCLVIVGLTFAKLNEKANMLTTSVYLLFASILYCIGHASNPSLTTAYVSKKTELIFYTILSLTAALWISLSNETNPESEAQEAEMTAIPQSPTSPSSSAWQSTSTEEVSFTSTSPPPSITTPSNPHSQVTFHLTFTLLSLLYPSLLTSFSLSPESTLSTLLSPQSTLAHHIQSTLSLCSEVMLGWTLIAPRIVVGRVFN